MTEYPILVERYRGKQALTIICEACGTRELISGDDILNEGLFACPAGCDGSATYMYQEADHRCGGCGKLGFFEEALGNCCSRVCRLQAEYAKTLRARRAAA